jgi:hypothetical protein
MTDAEFSARLDRLIEAFENTLSNAGATINRTAGSFSTVSSSLRNTASAASFAERAFEAYTGSAATATNVERLKVRVGEQLVDTFKTLFNTSVRASEALYSAESGVGSFSRTIDDVRAVLGNLKAAFTGFNIAKLHPALAAVGLALDSAAPVISGLATLVQNQLNLMQQQIRTYNEVNRIGAMFGGTLTNMQTAAREVGVSLPMLGKMILDNVEDLSKFGFGVSHSSTIIAEHAANTARSNRALLNLYGSTEELAKGTANYIALQTQLGDVEGGDVKKNSAGVNNFLLRQKELAEITGKRTDQLKQEEQERRRNLAYTAKLGRLGDVARQNVTEGMAVAGKMFGEEGAAYAREFFATGGKVVSRESLIFAATMPEAAEAVKALITNVDQSKEDYRKGVGEYFDANKDALQKFAQGLEQFAEINFAANNPILTSMTKVGSEILASANFINNINNLFKAAEEEAEKRRKGLAIVDGKGAIIDTVSEVIHAAEKIRLENQVKIDAMVTENFGKMMGIIKAIGEVQMLQAQLTSFFTGIAGSVTDKIYTEIQRLRESIGGGQGGGMASVEEQDAINQALRNQAPVTSTPAQAGTATTPGGSAAPPVPLPVAPPPAAEPARPTGQQVSETNEVIETVARNRAIESNNSDLVFAINKLIENQNSNSQEVVRVLKDSKDVQEKLLYSMA